MKTGSRLAVAFLLGSLSTVANAQQIASIVDPLIEKDIAGGIPGAAFIFVREGKVVYQRGYGVSDLTTAAKVDPERTVWPIASITKAVTAMGALQLVGDGHVKLDGDLNRYLKHLQVPAQGYAPLTLRHILSHTGALDEIPGRLYDGKQSPDMAAFLKRKLVRYREPGKLTAYSTYGMALSDDQVFTVKAQPSGTLSLWGQTWLPLRKDLFVRDDGKRMLGFARDEKNKIVSVTGGSWRVADRLP